MLIEASAINAQSHCFSLLDYWLCRQIKAEAIKSLHQFSTSVSANETPKWTAAMCETLHVTFDFAPFLFLTNHARMECAGRLRINRYFTKVIRWASRIVVLHSWRKCRKWAISPGRVKLALEDCLIYISGFVFFVGVFLLVCTIVYSLNRIHL